MSRLGAFVTRTAPPAIAALGPRVAAARRAGPLADLGQAVPGWGPPSEALARFPEALQRPELHRYTADEGRRSLRVAHAAWLAARGGPAVDPERELMITAGANQAFLMAAMTILSPGDRVGIAAPWYFNHAMAVDLVGAERVALPSDAARGYGLDVDRILERAEADRLAAVVLVQPSNPTGAIAPAEELARLAAGLAARGVWLISDETYRDFAPAGFRSPACVEPRPDRVITIGSFSKVFALTGWRVGWLAGAASLLEAMLKVQDTMLICAPHASQVLVELCLEHGAGWLDAQRAEIELRRRSLVAWGAGLPEGWRLTASGPFFGVLEGPEPGQAIFERLLDRARALTLPGEAFGPGMEHSVRLALGGLGGAALDEALDAIRRALDGGDEA